MRRLSALTVTCLLVVAVGCGVRNYEARTAKTIENLRYAKRVDDNLMPPQEGRLKELSIFFRPPKSVEPAKNFMIPVTDPTQFDVGSSFLEGQKSAHILARVKQAKAAGKKGQAAPASSRGDFSTDVLNVIAPFYGAAEDLQPAKLKEDKQKANTFRRGVFKAGPLSGELYLHKDGDHDTAILFLFPTSEHAALSTKINLCLETFATGAKATAAFAGKSEGDEESESAEGEGVAF